MNVDEFVAAEVNVSARLTDGANVDVDVDGLASASVRCRVGVNVDELELPLVKVTAVTLTIAPPPTSRNCVGGELKVMSENRPAVLYVASVPLMI